MAAQTFPGIKIPLVADSKIGPSWGETKAVVYKDCWRDYPDKPEKACPFRHNCPYRETKEAVSQYLNKYNTLKICPVRTHI